MSYFIAQWSDLKQPQEIITMLPKTQMYRLNTKSKYGEENTNISAMNLLWTTACNINGDANDTFGNLLNGI